MNQEQTSTGSSLIAFVIVGVIIAALDYIVAKGTFSILFALSFFIALAEGPIAIVAVAEIAEGEWVKPLKRKLLATYPMILFIAVLFPLMALSGKMDHYPWAQRDNFWFNPNFFIIRNVVVLLATCIIGKIYANASLNEKANKSTWAVFYALIYVTSMSMVAFDWIMPLEYPWFSTLLGGFFFVEGLYLSFALSGVLLYFVSRQLSKDEFDKFTQVRRDIGTFLFAFSVLWGYLFFAQFLPIWYGNLPEFVSFFTHRLDHGPMRQLMFAIIPILFGVPFCFLLSRKAKIIPEIVLFLSIVVLLGVILERYVIIGGMAPLNLALIPVYLILLTIPLASLLKGKEMLPPPSDHH